MVQVPVSTYPGEPEEASGWKSQSVSWRAGEKAFRDESATVP